MRKRAIKILIELGVPANIKGFHYICDAMEIFWEDESFICGKTIELYEQIARLHNTERSRVERCIRHAFNRAFTYGNLDSLNRHMSAAQHPSNGNLLACLYLKLKGEL